MLYLQRWTWYHGIRRDFNTTGSDLEINAFKNIIEWVNGKRKVTLIRLAMLKSRQTKQQAMSVMSQVSSWAGTTTCVAATGAEGLLIIVPAAGIASWYDYFNITVPSLVMHL